GGYVRRASASLGEPQGFAIGTRVCMKHECQQPDRSGMFTAVAGFPLEHVATVAPKSAVESETVGKLGFGGAGIAKRPSPCVKFMHPAPGVSAGIGRIVPGAVIHDCPAHELGARVMCVAVIVQEIGDRKPPGHDSVASHGTLAGELVLRACDRFCFSPETEIVGDIDSCQVRLRRRAGDSRQLTVREICYTRYSTEAFPSGYFGIEVELGVLPQTDSQVHCGSQGNIPFGVIRRLFWPV